MSFKLPHEVFRISDRYVQRRDSSQYIMAKTLSQQSKETTLKAAREKNASSQREPHQNNIRLIISETSEVSNNIF